LSKSSARKKPRSAERPDRGQGVVRAACAKQTVGDPGRSPWPRADACRTADYTDEFYRANAISRNKVDVLLRFDPASAPGSGLPRDGDFPLVWTKNYGEGRVVYSSLSHSTEAWDVRNVQIMMFEAIRWSLGLSESPVQPHAKRDQPDAPVPR
jgi:type 1 glutamine amidotransferase